MTTPVIGPSACIADALVEPVIDSLTGELLIRQPRANTRVCFFRGRIAWAHCDGHRAYLSEAIAREAGLAISTLGEHLRICRARKHKLGEHLVREGVITRRQLARCLRRHLEAHLAAAAEAGEVIAAELYETEDRYDLEFTISLWSLVDEGVLPGPSPCIVAHQHASLFFHAWRRALPHLRAAGLVDRPGGELCASWACAASWQELLEGIAPQVPLFAQAPTLVAFEGETSASSEQVVVRVGEVLVFSTALRGYDLLRAVGLVDATVGRAEVHAASRRVRDLLYLAVPSGQRLEPV
jgi:hypothetical protein